MVFGSPKKTVDNSIKKIDKGHGSKKIVESLKKALQGDPELIGDTTLQLIGIIQTDKTETFGYCLEVLLEIAETEPDLLANSADAFIKLIQMPDDGTLDNNSTLIALDILSIIVAGYPEVMQPAVPALLKKMKSSNSNIRSATYYILDIISKTNPEFFSDHTPDLIRSLNGLNVDERIYAARLIGEIANSSPKVIDESYDILNDLASKHPNMELRQEAYDVLKKIMVKETPDANTKEPTEFEKDFIGIDEVKSEDVDFAELADDLSERIKGMDFEASAAEMLKSLDMEHLIVKPEFKNAKPANEVESFQPEVKETDTPLDEKAVNEGVVPVIEDIDDVEDEPPKKLPPKLKIDDKAAPEHALNRIEQLVTDPNIKPRLSPVKDISPKDETESQEHQAPESPKEDVEVPKTELETQAASETEVVNQGLLEKTEPEVTAEPEPKTEYETTKTTSSPLPEITIEMVHAIFSELSNEDWVRNIGLTTNYGALISAIKPETMDSTLLKKISDMLSFEENVAQKEGFRNRVSIELSDKNLVAMSINSNYIMVVFTDPDVKFGLVLYQLDRTAEKIEQILE